MRKWPLVREHLATCQVLRIPILRHLWSRGRRNSAAGYPVATRTGSSVGSAKGVGLPL